MIKEFVNVFIMLFWFNLGIIVSWLVSVNSLDKTEVLFSDKQFKDYFIISFKKCVFINSLMIVFVLFCFLVNSLVQIHF